MKNSLWIFDHIPKTAGTSIARNIRLNADTYYYSNSIADWAKIKKEIPSLSGKDVTLFGHRVRGIHELFGSEWNAKYITMLREPVDLYLSHYFYQQQVGENADSR